MDNKDLGDIQYSIWDPTGNITALVESDVCIEDQLTVAAKIMERHADVEQVGFVRFDNSADAPVQVNLRMAGGEFCGNASMCAAALYVMTHASFINGDPFSVDLFVSGSKDIVHVGVWPKSSECFETNIQMPQAQSINESSFEFNRVTERVPVVRMEGISHVMIMPQCDFYDLLENRQNAELAVKKWCGELACSCLGLMFLEKKSSDQFQLTPLVYVPGCETMFWENSCSSGSAAAGMYLSKKTGEPMSVIFHEPGGSLRAESDFYGGMNLLFGKLRFLGNYTI